MDDENKFLSLGHFICRDFPENQKILVDCDWGKWFCSGVGSNANDCYKWPSSVNDQINELEEVQFLECIPECPGI